MSDAFQRLYRIHALADDRERLQRRWAGVCRIAETATIDDIEALLRLVFGTRQMASASSVARIRQRFKDADDLFEMSGNDREFETLSCGALLRLFESRLPLGPAAALASLTTGFAGTRTPTIDVDVVAAAQTALVSHAKQIRIRPDLTRTGSVARPALDLTASAKRVREKPDSTGMAEAFEMAGTSLQEAMGQLASLVATQNTAVGNFIAIQDEELQMLWWLTGQRSLELDVTFDQIPANARPIVLAAELAKMTSFVSNPATIKALLARSGVETAIGITAPVAVNACTADWLRPLVETSEPSPVTQPLHFAAKRRLEAGNDDAWVAAWSAATGIGADRAIPALELGNLFFCERLFAASLRA